MPITFVVHFLIHVTIPLCAQCFETSASTIRHKWMGDIGFGPSSLERRMFLRTLKSMQSVAFHSGNVARVSNEMRLNFRTHFRDDSGSIDGSPKKQIAQNLVN